MDPHANEQLYQNTVSELSFARRREIEGLSRKLARQDAAIADFRRSRGLPEAGPELDMTGNRAA